MRRVCEILVGETGYLNAWVISIGEDGSLIISGEAGLEHRSEEFRRCLESGKFIECNPGIMESDDTVLLKPLMVCPGCPLAEGSPGSMEMTIPISYLDQRYGLLIVSLDPEHARNRGARSAEGGHGGHRVGGSVLRSRGLRDVTVPIITPVAI